LAFPHYPTFKSKLPKSLFTLLLDGRGYYSLSIKVGKLVLKQSPFSYIQIARLIPIRKRTRIVC